MVAAMSAAALSAVDTVFHRRRLTGGGPGRKAVSSAVGGSSGASMFCKCMEGSWGGQRVRLRRSNMSWFAYELESPAAKEICGNREGAPGGASWGS